MARSYAKIRPHRDRVYDADAVQALYKISTGTLGNWGREGLRAVEGTRPRLYRGAELVRFHSEREARTRKVLREGEFKCFGCKAIVSPEPSAVRLHKTPKFGANASCPLCGTALTKKLGETEYDKFRSYQDANTTWDRSGESSGREAVGIGGSGQGPVIWNAKNERLIYEWQVFAGKYSDKTINAHLADIRRFEAFTGIKTFTEITPVQAAAYRERLVEGYRMAVGDKRLSASTVRHAASYLRSFFDWVEDRGRRAVRPSISGYFALPKSLHQSVAPRGTRDYLPLEVALEAAKLLPGDDLLARRDRAIFCLAYIGALRESALISLRLRHVDMVARLIRHDGRELRAKNGKDYMISWFPGTEAIWSFVKAWVEELGALGATPEDALFPDAKTLRGIPVGASDREMGARACWAPMDTAHAVDTVFQRAGALVGRKITPHSARHTMARHGEQTVQTPKQRKAWSMSMGHDNETTTWGNYGKMTEEARARAMAQISEDSTLSYEDLELLVRRLLLVFSRDSPEFQKSEQLLRLAEAKYVGKSE